MVRKHKGIIQTGWKKGTLKKGYYYTGKRTINGLTVIKKVNHFKGGGVQTLTGKKLNAKTVFIDGNGIKIFILTHSGRNQVLYDNKPGQITQIKWKDKSWKKWKHGEKDKNGDEVTAKNVWKKIDKKTRLVLTINIY